MSKTRITDPALEFLAHQLYIASGLGFGVRWRDIEPELQAKLISDVSRQVSQWQSNEDEATKLMAEGPAEARDADDPSNLPQMTDPPG